MLINYLGNKCDWVGKLLLTNYRCMFLANKQSLYHENDLKFDFPLSYISRCDSSSESINKTMVFYLEITTKFLMSFKLKTSSPSISKASTYINELLGTSDKTRFGENRADILDEMQHCKKWEYYYSSLNL